MSVCLAGVLTKLDIMDPGTNAREVLEGAAVKLKHGWIGVVNRGQADINSRVGPAAFSDWSRVLTRSLVVIRPRL